MSKQSTLSFKSGSSSSTSVSSKACTLTEANIASLLKNPLAYFYKRWTRQVPKPNGAGSAFTLFPKDCVSNPKPSGKRTLNRTADQLITFGNQPVKMDVAVMERALEITSTNRKGITTGIADAVYDFMTRSPVQVYKCMPCLQMRAALMECTYTQVKDTHGNVIGVRAPCPCCETNEYVTLKT